VLGENSLAAIRRQEIPRAYQGPVPRQAADDRQPDIAQPARHHHG
jgi:hypothetical protein